MHLLSVAGYLLGAARAGIIPKILILFSILDSGGHDA